MKLSDNGVDFIKGYEGFSEVPYLDVVGVPTIGFGTTHYEDRRAVKLSDPDMNSYEATRVLRDEVDRVYGHAVNTYVQVDVTQNQFDALVSFTYNEGPTAFKASHLLRYLNEGNCIKAANEFPKWTRAGLTHYAGLAKRREAERKLFLKDVKC